MPDARSDRVCPYLRGRSHPDPDLTPSENNRCQLAASIHLPRTRQARYCLGGRHHQCERLQRQGERPVPLFVRGVRPPAIRPSAPTPTLRILPWRRAWVRTTLKWLALILLAAIFIYLWRWRMAQTRPFIVERDPIPTAITAPTATPSPLYLRPTQGPPPW